MTAMQGGLMLDKEKTVYSVVGYTLDAVIEAHNLAMNEENKVIFYKTAPLGEPLDIYNDYISYDDARRLGFITHGLGYTECINNSYLYIPYELLKFKNSTNGVIQFPLNRNSFEDENEWNEICKAYECDDIKGILANASNSPTRLITMYKNNMPKWFVDSIVRNLADTRWKGIPTSALTLNGYLYEFSLSDIQHECVNKWYKPELSYANICELILHTDNIEIRDADKKTCFELITKRNIENVTFMDNRIDYYLDYRCGMFDRREMYYEKLDEVPSFMSDIELGFVRTPTLDCWGINVYEHDIRKLYCRPIKSITNVPTTSVPMTKNNIRTYDAYSKILPLYGKNKNLNIQQKIKTLIK